MGYEGTNNVQSHIENIETSDDEHSKKNSGSYHIVLIKGTNTDTVIILLQPLISKMAEKFLTPEMFSCCYSWTSNSTNNSNGSYTSSMRVKQYRHFPTSHRYEKGAARGQNAKSSHSSRSARIFKEVLHL